MTGTILRFEFPFPPDRGNARGHSRTHNNSKKSYWAQLDELQLVGKLPKPPRFPLAKVAATGSMHLPNKLDMDNKWARIKWPMDWLKTRGYIVDDSESHVRWLNDIEQNVDRSGRPAALIVTLVEVQP
jgi:hypothetical protein